MIHRRKKRAYVAFQDPASAGVVLRNFPYKRSKSVDCLVRPLFSSTRIRITDKGAIEKWIELAIDSVMQKPITYSCLVDVAGLGVRNIKCTIAAVGIYPIAQVSVKSKDIVRKMVSKFLHILLISLALEKLFPCPEQIFNRDDIFVFMRKDTMHPLNSAPPSHLFATKAHSRCP